MRPDLDAGGARPGPFLSALSAIGTALDWSGRLIAVACLAFMFALLLLNVVLRYAAGDGIAWAYEIHALLLPWLVAGGIVIAAARGANIAITILPEQLSPEAQRILLLVVQVAIFAISLAVLWSSQPILKAATFQKLATLGISQVWGYASLVYAFAAMGVIAGLESLALLTGRPLKQADPGAASLS